MTSSTFKGDSLRQSPDEPDSNSDSSSSGFPSSPPIDTAAEDRGGEMATSARKRTHDEPADEREFQQHAANVPKDKVSQEQPIIISSSQVDDGNHDLPSTITDTHSMMPPPPPPNQAKRTQPEAQQPPRSGQGSQRARDAQLESASTQVTASQSDNMLSETTIPDDEDQPPSPTPSEEPQDQIAAFDWTDLQTRYHDKMRELQNNELRIFDEFNQLCDFFGVWRDAMQHHEVGRSFKRLKTQMAYVRHEEDELEQKRNHYTKVVDAFKSALQLLGT